MKDVLQVQTLVPTQKGGGRPAGKPQATLYRTGQLVFNHAVYLALGEPKRVMVQMHVRNELPLDLVLTAIPDAAVGWTVSGGNSTYTISMRKYKDDLHALVGKLSVDVTEKGAILRRKP